MPDPQEQNKPQIPKLIESDILIPFSPKLAKVLGDLEALFLQQLHYHTYYRSHPYLFVGQYSWHRKSYDDWCLELRHSKPKTLQVAARKLENHHIIYGCPVNVQNRQQKWYTINHQAIQVINTSLEELVRLDKKQAYERLLPMIEPHYDRNVSDRFLAALRNSEYPISSQRG
ncbi:hypothetical protein [Herpetosiphon geysericola]|uniref:Uncharacterized protein n=1 Tax=Herpetosiphon geysericola TaxID=70996 RepID=A0A0P6Y8C8_9CHLR|nr:hypothetical protein [Herpetosiphon geysericola]KPL86144.1 hypothetical protein SE18_14900 [Herpetosiphon geysericola]